MEKKKKILVVDDEQALAKALELKLSHSGYEAKAVHDGKAAIEELKKNKYDLVLTDLVMPGTDGFALLADMQQRGDKTPTIVSSNLGQQEDIERAKALGADDYFVKAETSIAQVIEHIRRQLG
jgi:DNA-binding response OmpR family regulator